MASKNFFVDTNVLIDDPTAVVVLQNGEENQVYVPWTVIQELDKLKGVAKTRHRAQEAIRALDTNDKNIHILENSVITIKENSTPDDIILEEILCSNILDPIVVSNDLMLRIKAKQRNIAAEEYKQLIPFKAESQKYTGFIDKAKSEELITNCFYWENGKLHFWNGSEAKLVDYENEPWTITPKSPYQNAAMELMLNDSIDLVSIQSEAGFGKSYISLAVALTKVLEEKKYDKIYIVKPNIEIGESFGFLPGSLDDKMLPLFRSMHQLLLKLHKKRPAKVFKKKTKDEEAPEVTEISSLNKAKLEYMPINYMRGMDFEDCIIICDEIQNYTKSECKTLLSRMGKNVKCICLGDTEQVDSPGLNPDNNGLNWIVKYFKGQPNYAHIVLKGKSSRGPICDLTRKFWGKD